MRRHLRQRELRRYSVPLQVLDLVLQGRLGSVRTFLSDVDSEWRSPQDDGDVGNKKLRVVCLRDAFRHR
jgi:hypothetical protein